MLRGRFGRVAAGLSLGVSAALAGTLAVAPGAVGADDELADWTFMVYAVGDTDNVAEIMVQNLSQLAAVPDDAEVNVVLLLDLPSGPEGPPPTSTLPGAGQFDTAKLFVLDGGRFNEIRDLGEVSMGRPDVLADFIEESAGLYPAEKYGLTLFDHGAGNGGGYFDIGGAEDAHLNVPAMRDGISAGMARAGIDEFELIFHAACLMSNYETTSALAPLSKTMAGSEEIMVLYPLSPAGVVRLGEDADGLEVGKALVDGYTELLDDPEIGLGQSNRELMAMSVIDSEAMSRLDAAIEAFAEAVVPRMDELAPDIARARGRTLEFARPFGYDGFNLVDLGDFLRHLDGLPPEVEVARDAAYAALEGVVRYHVTGRGTEQTTGLNVFFPTDPRAVRGYLTDGTTPPGWAKFLSAYLQATTDAPDGQVSFVEETPEVLEEGPGGIKIQGRLASGEATSASTYVLSQMGDQDRAYSLVLPGYLDAGGQQNVQGVWDYSRVSFTDGETTIPVTTVLQPQSGGLIGSFDAQYTDPRGAKADFAFRILLSSEGEVIALEVVNVAPQGGAAPANIVGGGEFTPYLYVQSSGGAQRVLSSESIPDGPNLGVDFVPMPAGSEFDMRLVARDLSGDAVGITVAEQVG
jgi:hypothetical protein